MYKSVHYDKNCASCYQHLAYVHKCVYVYVFVSVSVCVCVMHGCKFILQPATVTTVQFVCPHPFSQAPGPSQA